MGNGPFLCRIIHCWSETNSSTSRKALQPWQGASLSRLHFFFPAPFSPPCSPKRAPRRLLFRTVAISPNSSPHRQRMLRGDTFLLPRYGEVPPCRERRTVMPAGRHPRAASLPFLCTEAMQPAGRRAALLPR